MLHIAEIFDSIQGEGSQIGSFCRFVRLAGCNRSCEFCDTDHNSTMMLSPFDLAESFSDFEGRIVFTGGEPLLQKNDVLETCKILKNTNKHYLIDLETNGSIALEEEELGLFDSISLSPKQYFQKTLLKECDSLKILYPYQSYINILEFYNWYVEMSHIYLIPTHVLNKPFGQSIQETITEVVRLNSIGLSKVKLGVQLHKLIGVQ